MFNIAEIEKTIQTMRAQAAQLEASAQALELMIEPWKHTQVLMEQTQKTIQHLWHPWIKP
jgi:exonuclease VII small subunit